MSNGQFLDTVGIEFEGAGVSIRTLNRFSEEQRDIHVTRDASVESNASLLPNGMLLNTNALFTQHSKIVRNTILGYEMVTVPLLKEEVAKTLANMIYQAKYYGDYLSPRASIHVHVGFAYNLNLLKKALAIGLAYDPLLYMLAGMGTEYRGVINASIYARPLEAGVAVPIGDSIIHLLPEMALKSKSVDDFWHRFLIFSGVNRYHPGRYFATNLYSTLLHQTLEFRHFNQCFNIRFVGAIVNLCQVLAKLANIATLSEILSQRQLSIFDLKKGDGEVSVMCLLKKLHKYNISFDSSYVDSLLEILDKTEVPIFSKKVPFTHIPSSRNSFVKLDWMVFLSMDDCVQSNYLDIHNIGRKEISILDKEY